MAEIVKEVLQAEQRANEIIAKAESDKEKAIVDAKQQAVALLARRQEEARQQLDKEFQYHKEKLQDERAKILDQARLEAETISRKAAANIDTAVSQILSGLVN